MALTKVTYSMIDDAPVNVADFAVGDGVTDDTSAINAAITAAATGKQGLVFESGKSYLVTSQISISNSGNTVPLYIDGNGSTLIAKSTFTDASVLYVENPQGKVDTFSIRNLFIDGNATGGSAANYGLYVKGSQDAIYSQIQVIDTVSHGFLIQGESGYGIYYNVFDTCKAGVSGDGCGGSGFKIAGVTSRYANSNTFLNCASQYNNESGFNLAICSGNSFIGCAAEESATDAGYRFGDLVTSVSIIGGFTENNTYSATDTSFRIVSGATVDNIRISGGRHNGTTDGDFTQDGIMYDTTSTGDVTIWNTDLKIRNLTLGGSGANIVSADATSIRFGDTLNPDADDTYNLGSGSLGWAIVFAHRFKNIATTVASLPSASSAGAGARMFVTDANATTFASIVAGGGSNGVPVYSDGTNWRIG